MRTLSRLFVGSLALVGIVVLAASPVFVAPALANIVPATEVRMLRSAATLEQPTTGARVLRHAETAGEVALVRCLTIFGMMIASWSMALVTFSGISGHGARVRTTRASD